MTRCLLALVGITVATGCGSPGELGAPQGPEAHELEDPALQEMAVGFCVDPADPDLRDNLAKYWHYRDRYRSDFTVISADDEPGTNIPIATRRFGWSTFDPDSTTIAFGDNTIHQAYNLAVLATEYALLRDVHPDTVRASTLPELFYALRALERIDAQAEAYFRTEERPLRPLVSGLVRKSDRNGFFIRDDAPADFAQRFDLGDVDTVRSSLTEPYEGFFATEMSQDQVWHLLVGLALINELVDYQGPVAGRWVDFRRWAKVITYRIVRYQRDHDNWRIENPVHGDYVLRGAEMDARRVCSYGFARAANWILSREPSSDIVYPNMHNTASRLAAAPFKAGMDIRPGTLSLSTDNDSALRSLATIGDIRWNPWHTNLWNLEHRTLATPVDKFEHLPLVYVLLHGGSMRIAESFYGGLLNAAPWDGPRRTNTDDDVCAWSSGNRLVWPRDGSIDAWSTGESNGLDYMLLHNLYQLVYDPGERESLYAEAYGDLVSWVRTPEEATDRVRASSFIGDAYAPWQAFDGNSTTKWVSGAESSPWVEYAFEHSRTVIEYTLRFGDGLRLADRAPRAWRLLGSRDGETWHVLDVVKDQPGWSGFEARTFTVDTPRSYRQYRLQIDATQGGPVVSLAGLELLGHGPARARRDAAATRR